jgi:DNA-binding transcriptional LysR family regulator
MATSQSATLAELRAFAAVAELRNFRKAADLLGLAPSTISHMVTQLEGRLNERLLNRSTRSVAPTHAGAQLAERLRPLLIGLTAALNGVGDDDGEPRGPLRITASETVAMLVVRHVVPELTRLHPAITLDLVAEPALLDIVAEGFDAGIRLGEAVPRDMIAARIGGPSRMLPVVSRSYYATLTPPPLHPQDLLAHRCIAARTPAGRPMTWEFERNGERETLAISGPLTLNRTELMLEAALAGLGIALLPERLAKPLLDSGELVSLLDDWCPSYPGLFVFYPGHRHVPAALKAFIAVARATIGGEGVTALAA